MKTFLPGTLGGQIEQTNNNKENSQTWQHDYKLLSGSVVPRPIAWVSTLNRDKTTYNLAPFSFFTVVSINPMVIGFSPIYNGAADSLKDTTNNILEQKQFVVNFVSKELAEKCNETSINAPYGTSEFALAGLTLADSIDIEPKGVAESPIRYECEYLDHLSYGDQQPGSGMIITGKIVRIHIDEEYYDNGRVKDFGPVGRGAGPNWIYTDHQFQLDRPTF